MFKNKHSRTIDFAISDIDFQINWETEQQLERLKTHVANGGTIPSFLYGTTRGFKSAETAVSDLLATLHVARKKLVKIQEQQNKNNRTILQRLKK